MIETLAAIARQSRLDDPFFSTFPVEQKEMQLEQMRGAVDSWLLHAEVAEDYLRLGNTTKAVEHIETAEHLLERRPPSATPARRKLFLQKAGTVFLRIGEIENCVHCQNSESCILPIHGQGTHTREMGSRRAMDYFQKLLEMDPGNLTAQWLLNIAAMTLNEFPDAVPEEHRLPADTLESKVEFPHFTEIAGDVGVRSVTPAGGVVADDFNNDGLIDLMVSDWSPDGQVKVYRNPGTGAFEDVTGDSNLKGIVGALNMIQADFDNDGKVDVLMMRGAWLSDRGRQGMQPLSLLKNLGDFRFQDVTFEVGLAESCFPTPTAQWMDFDNDGDLDLFLGHEETPCQLFRNEGGKSFTDVSQAAGITNDGYTKAASCGDYDGDRYPDIYVSNLQQKNRLYHNNRDGTFTDVAETLEVTKPAVGFGAWFWDVNNDGRMDIFASSYNFGVEHTAAYYFDQERTDEPDCLYIQTPDGRFEESSEKFGLTHETQPMGHNFGDLDNDGFLDFYLGTGYPKYEGLMPNLMFHNKGGVAFEDVTIAGGFGHLQKGHGVAFADFDNDGDQEVFEKMGGAYPGDAFGDVLFENPGFGNRWIRVKLVGVKSNRSAIGARIKAIVKEGDASREIVRWVNSGGTFGANPLAQQIGLGKATSLERLEVYWPTSDTTQTFQPEMDSSIEITEGRTEVRPQTMPRFQFSHNAVASEAK
jgi:hypothetical protein